MSGSPVQPSRPTLIEMVGVTVPARLDPERAVIRDMTWNVQAGDFWVLGGLQGAGKSDLLAMIAALTPPLSGSCRVLGRLLTADQADEDLEDRLRIGLVFDHGGRLFNQLDVWDNVALPLRYHRDLSEAEGEQRVARWLEALELAALASRLPSNLNPHWRQRVALGRALILEPELVLLDNPLTILDPWHIRWWMDFLGRLSAGHPLLGGRPVTLITTTDDFRPWRGPGCQFGLLQDGAWTALGHWADLGTRQSPLLRDLLATEMTGL